MKNIVLLFVSLLLFIPIQAQTEVKNNQLQVSYTYLTGNDDLGHVFNGSGYEISYRRYLFLENFYARVSFGKNYVNVSPVSFPWLKSDEMMNLLTIGLGYDIFHFDNFVLGAELNYLNITNHNLLRRITDEHGHVISNIFTEKSHKTLQLGLNLTYLLSEHILIRGAFKYGAPLENFETFLFTIGAGYQFDF